MTKDSREITFEDLSVVEMVSFIIARAYPEASEAQIKAVNERLMLKTRDEVQHLYQRAKDAEEEERRRQEEELRLWTEEDFDFNQFAIGSDFARWAKKPFWTRDEAGALLLGRKPETTNWDVVRLRAANFPTAAELDDVFDRINRAIEIGLLEPRIIPAVFIAWAKDDGFPVPPELETAVSARNHCNPSWQLRISDLDNQLSDAVAKLVATENKLSELSVECEQLRDQLSKSIESGKDFQGKERNSVYSLMVAAFERGLNIKFAPEGIPDSQEMKDKFDDFFKWLREETKIDLKDKERAREWLKKASDHVHSRLRE